MKKIVIFAICFFLSGCATVFSGTSQNINVKVVDTATNNCDAEHGVGVGGESPL